MITVPRPPAIPASLAALVTLAGLGLVYWSLSGLGLIRPADAPVVAQGAGLGNPLGGGFSGGNAGSPTPGGSTGTPSGGGAGGGF